MRVSKEVLANAQTATTAGKNSFAEGKAKIDNIFASATTGEITESVAEDILRVKETIEPLLKKAQEFFDQNDEIMMKANREYDNKTEEAQNLMNKNAM